MTFAKRYSHSTPRFTIKVSNPDYTTLPDLFNANGAKKVYPFYAIYINRNGKYGPQAVLALSETLLVNLPQHKLEECEKILQDTDDFVAFTLGSKHILFQIGNATLVCRLLEGEFLDWRRVVPTNCPVKLTAHVSDLASSIERVGLIVSEKYKSPVRCVFGKNVLQLRTQTTIGAAEDRCTLAGDGIATSLAAVTGKPVNKAALEAEMLQALKTMDETLFHKEAILERYRKSCITLNQQICVVRGDEISYGTALDVDSEGALVVRFEDGTVRAVSSGEVSVRGMYGYLSSKDY